MAQDWEDIFNAWSKPPGQAEQDRYANAESAVRNAIKASDALKKRDIKIFTQGSYRNNTNVRKDSDVDIGIVCYDVFFKQLPEGAKEEDFDFDDATYTYSQFKNEVGDALVSYFGSASVSRGNKAFNIKENSYHVEADVAPFFEHRRYDTNKSYISGVELRPDNGDQVINWPEQHYENGVNKNNLTERNFKAGVRILKSLAIDMEDNGIVAAKQISGFLIECLMWNVPNDNIGYNTYKKIMRACLAHLFNNTLSDEKCTEWGEVSELKYLFRGTQKWTREQAHSFISSAWDYVEFE